MQTNQANCQDKVVYVGNSTSLGLLRQQFTFSAVSPLFSVHPFSLLTVPDVSLHAYRIYRSLFFKAPSVLIPKTEVSIPFTVSLFNQFNYN